MIDRILIIGATSAIAHAVARRYAARGARLFLIARRPEPLEANAADLRVRGAGEGRKGLLDANDLERHANVLDEAFGAFGGFDAALVAHGTLPDQAECERSVQAMLASFDTNARSTIALLTLLAIVAFYKELLVSSFDPGLSYSLGINATLVHYALMAWLSVVVVSAFESVGAILVIAMLILPGATASLLSQRLPVILLLSVAHAAFSAVLGLHLALWLECSVAGAMVVMATVLFVLVWFFSPTQGLIQRWARTRLSEPAEPVGEPIEAGPSKPAST